MTGTSLADALFSHTAMAEAFGDVELIRHALAFEQALAEAEAKRGIIPHASATAIAAACASLAADIDVAALARDVQRAGTLAIPLVRRLTERVAAIDRGAAGHVHLGATSQDVADTAVALMLLEARRVIAVATHSLAGDLVRLAEAHRATPMLGRTLLQPGPPITFGLKVANWLLGLVETGERVEREHLPALVLQFGGAVGTLAPLGDRGGEVARELGARLGLPVPAMPAHTRRGAIAGFAVAVGLHGLAAAKIATDIALLMQFEVGEAAEPGGAGRGGSSTMPHKQNPIASMIALGAAARLPGLIGTMAGALVQEHERAVGRWQVELPVMRDIFMLTAAALEAVGESIAGLVVVPGRMALNIDRLSGLIFAERVMLKLAPKMGRGAAHVHMEALVARAIGDGAHLRDVVRADTTAAGHLTVAEIDDCFDATSYLGSADAFVTSALERARGSVVFKAAV